MTEDTPITMCEVDDLPPYADKEWARNALNMTDEEIEAEADRLGIEPVETTIRYRLSEALRNPNNPYAPRGTQGRLSWAERGVDTRTRPHTTSACQMRTARHTFKGGRFTDPAAQAFIQTMTNKQRARWARDGYPALLPPVEGEDTLMKPWDQLTPAQQAKWNEMEAEGMGLDPNFEGKGVTLTEWPQDGQVALDEPAANVRISLTCEVKPDELTPAGYAVALARLGSQRAVCREYGITRHRARALAKEAGV